MTTIPSRTGSGVPNGARAVFDGCDHCRRGVLPAVISEANILSNRVHHACEVFRGVREIVRDLELEM